MFKRKEIIGDCTLYLGDNKDLIESIECDAIVTDPPYVLDDSTCSHKSNVKMRLQKFKSDKYKNLTNGFDVLKLFSGLKKSCKPFNMFMFCSNSQIAELMSYCQSNFMSATLLVWHKTNAAPFANGVWRSDIEYIIHARGKGSVFQGGAVLKKKVSEFPCVIDKMHPTVKPIELIKKYIEISSNKCCKLFQSSFE